MDQLKHCNDCNTDVKTKPYTSHVMNQSQEQPLQNGNEDGVQVIECGFKKNVLHI